MTIPKRLKQLKNNRAAMVAAYEITPIRRFQCLPSKPVQGLYPKPCTEKAYQFTAKAKGCSSPLFSFYTGHAVGDELLSLLGVALPPIETWEMVSGGAGGCGGDEVVKPGPSVHIFNSALLRLLNLFFFRHEFDPTKPSGQMFTTINKNPNIPHYRCATALNTVLLRHGETSTKLVTWLATQVGAACIRPYDFATLHNYLATLSTPPAAIAICKPY